MPQRFPDWPERLIAYIAAREALPFEWGKGRNDCCSFGNGAVVAQTGEDPMADIPDYACEAEALAILEEATSLEALIDARLPLRVASFAQRGDVALAYLEDRATVMVVEGETIVGPGLLGLVRLNRADIIRAWAV